VVLQDVFLFAGTVASNLTLDREDVRLEDAIEAARIVNADPFIRRLPSAYQERVRERGNNLSAGQRQLLAFARALAYRPTILILDEATSSVDTETEYLIQDALEKLLRDRTAVVIAHRLSTIERADRILVMLGGEIRERGTHAELLRQRGLYFKLYELQYALGEIRAVAPDESAVVQEQ
jgi:ABC-type multidrug transport system fused ATPase/permease subunit